MSSQPPDRLPPPSRRFALATLPWRPIRYREVKTEADRWAWHADIYAFRRVFLDVPYDVRISPADPEGEWFNERLVAEATARYRARYHKKEDTP
jgi:hypothetical protein